MKRIADYRIERIIGEGNHGTFYLAVPPPRLGLDAPRVALKVLARNASDTDFRRVANELALFASLRSPHLVELHDAGHDRGRLFYAIPFHERGSLADVAGTAAVSEAVRAVASAARGAHALHEVGVAHRDIKPANVLLTASGAVLADLGLAQILDPGQTSTGTGPLGAIEYVDPALLKGDRASRATDIWSLGVTLHRALTGRSIYGPLPQGDVVKVLRHVLATAPAVAADLPPAIASTIAACLAPPEQRPATALELADRLEQAVAGS